VHVRRARDGELDRAGGPASGAGVPKGDLGGGNPARAVRAEVPKVGGHLVDRGTVSIERGHLCFRDALPVPETRGPVEATRGDQDAAERESERVVERLPLGGQRVPKASEVSKRLRRELTTRLPKERERSLAPLFGPSQDPVTPPNERARVGLEVRLHAGGEHGRGEELGTDGPGPGPTRLHEGRAA